MGDRFPGSIHDLALLTAAAFELSKKAAGRCGVERRLEYASHVFVAVCLSADGILRLHPESGFYRAAGDQHVWHVTGIAALSRVLMEACANLHYFALEDVTEEEREFRFLLADLQCHSDRLRWVTCLREERRKQQGQARDGQAVSVSTSSPEHEREIGALPGRIERLSAELCSNDFYKHLSCSGRRKMKKQHGFLHTRKERAERAGVARACYEAEYGHQSAYVHTGPLAVEQSAAFRADDPQARMLLIDMPIRSCCGYLALAVRHFLTLFPDLEETLPPEVRELVAYCVVYATGDPS